MRTATWKGRLVSLVVGIVVVGTCLSCAAALASDAGTTGLGSTPAVPAASPGHANAPVGDQRVFVEGDSLTVGISPYLPALLDAAGWTVTLDAQIGRDTSTGISMLSERTDEIGGTLVVALGTNDSPDPTAFSSRINQVMDIAAGRRVIWVTMARYGWDVLDEALIAAQRTWSNLEVIDWRPVIAAHPAMLAADGIHLTDAGYQLRADFIAKAIRAAN